VHGPLISPEQFLELAARQASFKVGLIFPPGLTGLQDGPDGRPLLRTVAIKIHPPGDRVRSLKYRGCGRMARGKQANVGARISAARDGVDGHVARTVPHEVLVEKVSVQQNRSPGGAA
jgi:hypothetical protein